MCRSHRTAPIGPSRLAAQPMTGDGALGTTPRYIEMSVGYSADSGGSGLSNINLELTRSSSQVDQTFAQAAFEMILRLGHFAAYFAMTSAERLWTTGYCLEIAVPSMGGGTSETVAADSTAARSIPHMLEASRPGNRAKPRSGPAYPSRWLRPIQ